MALVLAHALGPPMIWARRSRAGQDAGPAGRPPDPPERMGEGWREDGELVERSRVDPEAFGALYDKYCGEIFGYVHRRVGERAVAEDITAEVFFRALRAIDGYRLAAGPFSGWLYRIAANAVVDHLRARRPTVSLEYAVDAADRATPVDDQVISRVEVARVWDAIEQLSPAQRTAVTLRLGEDLPIAAIADRMRRTEGAVKVLLHRGLATVRAQLESPPHPRSTPHLQSTPGTGRRTDDRS